jgi:Flp pilus assembly protein TadG
MTCFFQRLRADRTGASAMEFALIAPLIFVMMLGVMQIGLWMHGFNGMRAVAAETSRYVTVEYQKGNPNNLTNYDMAKWARDEARQSAYILAGGTVSTAVTDDATQDITGVTKKTLTVNYQLTSFLGMIGIDALNLTFTRPIFVKQAAA